MTCSNKMENRDKKIDLAQNLLPTHKFVLSLWKTGPALQTSQREYSLYMLERWLCSCKIVIIKSLPLQLGYSFSD
jgi:hypothetical protein